MGMLDDRIKNFLAVNNEDDGGFGIGDAPSTSIYGSGNVDGTGGDFNQASGYGRLDGSGYGFDTIHTYNYNGYGYSNFYMDEYNSLHQIKEVNGDTVYNIDGLPTIIKIVHGNMAQGFILRKDLQPMPCFIVKGGNKFAHGITLHDAFISLQEKIYYNNPKEKRIRIFHEKFPKYDTPYLNYDLFTYHSVLTGSCRMGRESFCKDMGINLDGYTTIREFVNLTKNSYGGDIIRELPTAYGIIE